MYYILVKSFIFHVAFDDKRQPVMIFRYQEFYITNDLVFKPDWSILESMYILLVGIYDIYMYVL